ncbi:alanine--tRNA ligase [bacterium]|nr:alanine--tRNA ligase [bacterium]
MKSTEIRAKFIEFFKNKQHEFVPGSPIIPDNDPTLLFINAGMNQFKDVFLGSGTRAYQRAVNSQVCVRVSGKHNDLEDVGNDSTHLTSFEMLGNWSFGDYYKKEAIIWAWELFTKNFKISKDKLVATVFEDDDESLALWKSETDIAHQHIVKCDAKDNFWEMGATGPCGPCSEIHVYLQDGPIPNNVDQAMLNDGRFIELWNLVFIQYNRLANNELEPLPACHVDTGAGLERITAYLQGTSSNYQTDLFKPLIAKIETLSGVSYNESKQGMPHRVMADHIRTLVFGIADNVLLSNEGRGYVLRRLLRRACRYAKQLGFQEPVMYQLVDTVSDSLGDAYPQIKDRKDYIKQVVKAEEESFLKTLNTGLTLFETVVANLGSKTMISGNDAFKLYDTYGFPIDLTTVLAKEKELTVDLVEFESLLEQQRERSRSASKFDQEQGDEEANVTAILFDGLDLHLAEDLTVARGGEARVITKPAEKEGMARHHTATHLLHEVLRRELGDHVHQAGSLVDHDRLRFDFSHFEKVSEETLKTIERNINKLVNDALEIKISYESLAEAKKRGVMALFGEKYDPKRVRVVNIGGESVELCAGTHVRNSNQLNVVKLVSESAISAGTRRIEAIAGYERVSEYINEVITKHYNEAKIEFDKCCLEKEIIEAKNLQNDFNDIQEQLTKYKTLKSLDDKINYSEEFDRLNERIKTIQKVIRKEKHSHEQQGNARLIKELIANQEVITGKDSTCIIKRIDNTSIASLRHIADQLTNQTNNLIVVLVTNIDSKGIVLVKSNSNQEDFAANTLVAKITEKYGGGGGGRAAMAQAGGIAIQDLDKVITFSKALLIP